MGLWRWNGRRFERASFAAEELGLDAFVCCPGPSLAEVDSLGPGGLHVAGAMVLAVNTAYPRIGPDVWIGMDGPECYDPTLWSRPWPKVAGSRYAEVDFRGRLLKEYPNVHFATGTPGRPYEMFKRRGPEAEFIWNGNTFFTALHLAVWMGARRIYLVGCDFGGRADYHDGRRLPEEFRRRNRKLYAWLVTELPMLRLVGTREGIEIISCTPGSPANDYLPHTPLVEAVQRARENVPESGDGSVLDAADAELCRWTRPAGERDGVVTGCDADQEWLLAWWWRNYRRRNGHPVAFADFGMTDAGRAWCRKRGEVIDLRDVRRRFARPWFCKPFALLRSGFRRVAWIDLDCEVRGEVGPLFEYGSRGVAVAPDRHCPSYDSAVAWGDGVVAMTHGSAAASDWARAVLLRHGEIRGSQAALNIVLHEWRPSGRVVRLPREYHRLRLDGDPAARGGEVVIMHWTGEEGKRRVRRQMAGAAARDEKTHVHTGEGQ